MKRGKKYQDTVKAYDKTLQYPAMMIIWLLYRKTAVNLMGYPFFDRPHRKKISGAVISQRVPRTMQGYPRKISAGSRRKG